VRRPRRAAFLSLRSARRASAPCVARARVVAALASHLGGAAALPGAGGRIGRVRLIPASPCSYHVAAVTPEWRVRFLNHRGRLGAWAAPQIAPACTAPIYTWRASLLEAAPDMIQTEATIIVTPCTTLCWRPIAGALEELPPGSNCSFAWLAAATERRRRHQVRGGGGAGGGPGATLPGPGGPAELRARRGRAAAERHCGVDAGAPRPALRSDAARPPRPARRRQGVGGLRAAPRPGKVLRQGSACGRQGSACGRQGSACGCQGSACGQSPWGCVNSASGGPRPSLLPCVSREPAWCVRAKHSGKSKRAQRRGAGPACGLLASGAGSVRRTRGSRCWCIVGSSAGAEDERGCGPRARAAGAQVFYGLRLRAGDRILTSQHEYAANLNAFLQARPVRVRPNLTYSNCGRRQRPPR